jgi:hypothetical protein
VLYPPCLPERLVRRTLRLVARRRVQHHQRRLLLWALAIPPQLPLALTPLPNGPVYYTIYRMVAHYGEARRRVRSPSQAAAQQAGLACPASSPPPAASYRPERVVARAAGAKAGAAAATGMFDKLDQLQLLQRRGGAGAAGPPPQQAQEAQPAAGSPSSGATGANRPSSASSNSSGSSSGPGSRPIVFISSSELGALLDRGRGQQAALQAEALAALGKALDLPDLMEHYKKLQRLLPAEQPGEGDGSGSGSAGAK